jgi:hypothetical protein
MCSFCPLLHYGLCNSGDDKARNTFGVLDTFTKDWGVKEKERILCGGIRVTR